MTEIRKLSIFIIIIIIIGILGYMPIGLFQDSSDLVVDNYTVELSADGTLTETYDFNVGVSGRYTMLYRYREDTVTYNDTISIPHLSVIDVECPYIGYVKDSNGDVEIVNGGSSSFESIIWQKAFDNEIGCYKPSYYDKGNYELKIVYSINPPV